MAYNEGVKRQLWGWVCFCLATSFVFLSMPLITRSEIGAFSMCLLPIFFLIGVVVFAIWLFRTKLTYQPILGGVALMIVSLGVGFWWDSSARFLIYHVNYTRYHDYVAKTLPTLPKKEGRMELKRGSIPGFGVYGGHIERSKGDYILWINTHAGMTLQSTVFSPKPIPKKGRRFLRQDELGYWYLEDWERG